jgi:hypothetical protein
VSDEKTNVCEPLLTHRNVQMASKPGRHLSPGRKVRSFRACREPGSGLHVVLAVPGV